MNDKECPRCEGCGQIDSGDGAPWSYWMELPLRASGSILLGLVKPIPCPVCRGEKVSEKGGE